ncbi:hypothetical protein [Microbacterium sp. SZ1]|uniref:hypothetical protein n=1 Tax=Microbacterium sp. SZ1 TaxID=1849736 RepID=UPI0015CB5F56|nr:hypothetical protein [Microbacterium sp. SZ1]
MTTLIGSAEAAGILGIDRSVLLRRVASGQLEPVQKLPARTGAYLFDREAIEQQARATS